MHTLTQQQEYSDDERADALAALTQADLSRQMALHYANAALADARSELAAAIQDCTRAGISLRQVARELDLHHSTVTELLRRVEQAQAQTRAQEQAQETVGEPA